MGILNLMQILKKNCPNSIREKPLSGYRGKKLALDASLSIYQFLITTQSISKKTGFKELTDKDGNLTGHLLGVFNRSLQLMTQGIFPLWVFDGTPPEMKKETLAKRVQNKESAHIAKLKAIESGDHDLALKYANRSIKITPEMLSDTKTLITSLGLPFIQSKSEAEAQCSYLAKEGLVYGVVSEDMDSLAFGAPFLLRGVNAKSKNAIEIELASVLKELEISYKQFVDFCILCGCDYTSGVDVRGLEFIKEYQTIENILTFLKNSKSKYKPSDNFKYAEARQIFENPDSYQVKSNDIIWKKPDFDLIKEFLCTNKGKKFLRCKNTFNKKSNYYNEMSFINSSNISIDSQATVKENIKKGKSGKKKNKSESNSKK